MLLSARFNLSFMNMIIKDADKSALYISTAYNKGMGTHKYKHCSNLSTIMYFIVGTAFKFPNHSPLLPLFSVVA